MSDLPVGVGVLPADWRWCAVASMAVAAGVALFALAILGGEHIACRTQLHRLRAEVPVVRRTRRSGIAASPVASPWITPAWRFWCRWQPSSNVARILEVLAGRYGSEVAARLEREPGVEGIRAEAASLAVGLTLGLFGAAFSVSIALGIRGGARAAALGAALFMCGSLLSARVPWVLADRWLTRRGVEATLELPTLIDTVSLCTRAGMPFEQSIELYANRFPGSLSGLLREAGDIWRSGISTRRRELDRVSLRLGVPAIEAFFASVLQSMELGTPLAAVLDAQAAEARAQRHAAVEERIAKLPVKMLVPIGLFTLPAMLILLLAPVALQVLAGLG